jgi:hypothetical protein
MSMLANIYAIFDAEIVCRRLEYPCGRSISAAALKLVLLSLARHEGEPMPSTRIARVTGLGDETAKQAARVLAEQGLVEIQSHANTRRHSGFVAHRYLINIEVVRRLARQPERAAS